MLWPGLQPLSLELGADSLCGKHGARTRETERASCPSGGVVGRNKMKEALTISLLLPLLVLVFTGTARADLSPEEKAKLKAEIEADVAACNREGAKPSARQTEACLHRRVDERFVQSPEAKFLKKQNSRAVSALGYAKYSCRREGFIPGVDGFMDCISAKADEWWDKHAPAPSPAVGVNLLFTGLRKRKPPCGGFGIQS